MRSAIDQYIIDKIREIRTKKRISQADIAYGLGFESTSYIGRIESANPDYDDVYNVSHLNEIAKILNCSPKEFWPDSPL